MGNKIRVVLFASLLFLGVGAVNVSAQTDDPILKACEETADKAKRLEIENASLRAQLDIANQQLAVKDERIKNKDEQITFLKEKDTNNSQIDSNSQLIVLNLRQQIADDRLRIKDLEAENKSLRRSRDIRTVVGFGAGFATGYVLKKD
jgi:CRISPR/Cas system CMR subunit Cmr6 (Cas7 group RAMP superfamily)